MKHYIGLDVSMKETTICVVDEAGSVVYEGSELSDPKKLAQHIQSLKLNIPKIALESGSISHWLVSQMQEFGLPVICVDARHMAAILSLNVNKTDRNDARGIADALRAGLYREVCLKSQTAVDLCTLITARKILVNQRMKLKNTVRGLLKGYGIRLSTTGMKSFSSKVLNSIQELPSAARMAIEGVLRGFLALEEEEEKLERQIKEEALNDASARTFVMLTRTKLWSKPKAWAMKILRKKGMKKAAVALGRKLAVIMHRMLITNETYKLGDQSIEKEKIAVAVA